MPNSTTITPTPTFPFYLLPSLPFLSRRRRSSISTTNTILSPPTSLTSSATTTPTPSYLNSAPTSHLRCTKCLTDLLPTTSVISKGFTGRHGRAYLVALPCPSSLNPNYPSTPFIPSLSTSPLTSLPNTTTDPPQPRHLVTGAHTVADIRCTICKSYLGWKYVDAEEEAQKYKIGKFILEGNRVITGVDWEGSDCRNTEEEEIGGREGIGGMRDRRVKEGEEAVEFDSEDEDECEDLFAGVWSPKLAKWRRRTKRRDSAFAHGDV